MKYIRTEGNKIIAYDENATQLEKPMILNYPGKFTQADNIEELCDRFVLVDKNEYEEPIEQELIGKRYRAMLDELKFRISEGSDLAKMNFYGAIWTDKGLTYVAKMNSNGELELL